MCAEDATGTQDERALRRQIKTITGDENLLMAAVAGEGGGGGPSPVMGFCKNMWDVRQGTTKHGTKIPPENFELTKIRG